MKRNGHRLQCADDGDAGLAPVPKCPCASKDHGGHGGARGAHPGEGRPRGAGGGPDHARRSRAAGAVGQEQGAPPRSRPTMTPLDWGDRRTLEEAERRLERSMRAAERRGKSGTKRPRRSRSNAPADASRARCLVLRGVPRARGLRLIARLVSRPSPPVSGQAARQRVNFVWLKVGWCRCRTQSGRAAEH